MAFVLEPFFLDANQRAQAEGKSAFCHMVGLGLGVWEVRAEQEQWMMDATAELLSSLYGFSPSFGSSVHRIT